MGPIESWWLSFVDDAGFRGVIIVDVDADDRAIGLAYANGRRAALGRPPVDPADRATIGLSAAILKTHALGINPGGDVQGRCIDGAPVESGLPMAPRHRVLQKPQLQALGLIAAVNGPPVH